MPARAFSFYGNALVLTRPSHTRPALCGEPALYRCLNPLESAGLSGNGAIGARSTMQPIANQKAYPLPSWAIIPPAIYLFILPFAYTIGLRWSALVLGVVVAIRYRSVASGLTIPCKLPIILWITVAGMSLLWAINFEYSLGQFRVDVLYALGSFLVLFTLTASRREFFILIWSIWAGAVVISGFAVYFQVIYGEWVPSYQNFFGEFTSCMLMSISVIPLLLLDQGHMRRNTIAVVFAITLIAVACFFAHQRMFWIALAAMSSVASFMYFPFAPRRARALIIAGGTLLIAISILGYVTVSNMRGNKLETDPRPAIWARALENIKEKPFTGAGFGREVYRPRYLPLSRPGEGLQHAHNIFLSYADQMGIQGSIALAILFSALLYRFFKFTKLTDIGGKAVGIAGAALVVGTVARGMTDMHFSREVTLFFWANTGLLLGYGGRVIRTTSA
jgi:O-antigen ligase